jgi:hypothetical protein
LRGLKRIGLSRLELLLIRNVLRLLNGLLRSPGRHLRLTALQSCLLRTAPKAPNA